MNAGRDDDKTWAELVDAFNAEPAPDDPPRSWPAIEDVEPDDRAPYGEFTDPYHTASYLPGESAAGALAGAPQPASAESELGAGQDGFAEDDHFVPPVPPPIPRGDRVTRWAWTGMAAAPSVLLLSTITRWSPPDGLMMVLIGGFIAGFGTLVSRMRGRNPHDPDNGAIV
ncbi:hypothetical protein G1H11_23500 [Phytoactinopolyspora alkaliphila]|uniref:DUF308 domain-containing protein n=1 Tax=Phytoactinopolyspora alkaliphila TaxID=1783498 RepID=A0A6N9YTA8_9ACTN|nr:hypothetical protein [Phytoactinopolyspora alkaliphila]NED98271.1 hypothetical protein [Phytoactinopolyspora alkaliphila]